MSDALRTGFGRVDLPSDDHLYDSAPIPLVVVDENDRVVRANIAACELLAHGEPLVGTPLATWTGEAWVRHMREYLATGCSCAICGELEMIVDRPAGTRRTTCVRARSMPADPSLTQLAWLDVTETRAVLQRQRDFLQHLLDTVPVIVLLLDEHGHIVQFNQYFSELSGYDITELRGQSWFDTFVVPDDNDRLRDVHQHTLAHGSSEGVVNAIRLRDGSTRLIEWFNKTNERDDTVGVLAVGRDITRSQQLQHQFVEAQKMEVVGRVAGTIAHDFKNLLAGIRGVADVALKRAGDNEPAQLAIQQILNSTSRGVEMVDELLAISRKHTGRPVPIDIAARIRESTLMYRRILGKDVLFVVDLPAGPAHVVADPGQFDRVLLNLVVNARDALPGGGTVNVALRPCDACDPALGTFVRIEPGQWWLLTLSDDGIGMDETTRLKAFEPFFTTKTEGKGTGLGLAMVYAAIDRMGGDVRVESALGVGTTFTMALPGRPDC